MLCWPDRLLDAYWPAPCKRRSSSTIGTPSVVIPSPTAAAPTKTAVLGPQQIDLDPHFEITDKAQDRHFYWTIEEMWAAPDGVSHARADTHSFS